MDTPENPANESENKPAPQEVLVGYTMEEVDAIQRELETARSQATDYQDRWQRTLADFANLKRRTEREQFQMRDVAFGQALLPFLDVLDDLNIALQNRPQEGEGAAWANGIELVLRKVLTILEQQGVRVMEVQGQYFDPNLHEAISQEPNQAFESGQIIAAVKPGYLVGERVLRPAMVRVAA